MFKGLTDESKAQNILIRELVKVIIATTKEKGMEQTKAGMNYIFLTIFCI